MNGQSALDAIDRLRKHESITGMDFRDSPYWTESGGIDSDAYMHDVYAAKTACRAALSDMVEACRLLKRVKYDWGLAVQREIDEFLKRQENRP